MIGAETIHVLVGILMAIVAIFDLRDTGNPQRVRNATFWGAYAISLLFGSRLPDFVNGCLVIVLVLVAAIGGLSPGTPNTTSDEARRESSAKHRNRLFLPALLVPGITLAFALFMKKVTLDGRPIVEAKNVSLVGLSFAALVALVVALVMFKTPVIAAARESRRLLNLVGWAAILPQMLAALGVVFAAAGVGERIAEVLGHVVPLDNRFAVVCTYTFGMAIFTVIMGNAFAAFPVMTAAVGLPLIVQRFGGNPAIMAAVGMLSGFCGTLMTPMAANFNIVPALLLELPDRNGVIRVQIPTALLLLVANTFVMYFFVFRR